MAIKTEHDIDPATITCYENIAKFPSDKNVKYQARQSIAQGSKEAQDPTILSAAARRAKASEILVLVHEIQERLLHSVDKKETEAQILQELEKTAASTTVRPQSVKDLLMHPDAVKPLAAQEILKTVKHGGFEGNIIQALAIVESTTQRDIGRIDSFAYSRIPSSQKQNFLSSLPLYSKARIGFDLLMSQNKEGQKLGLEMIEEVLEVDPKQPTAQCAITEAYIMGYGMDKDVQKGAAMLRDLFEQNPSNVPLRSYYSYYLSEGLTDEKGGVVIPKDTNRAKAILSDTLRINPLDPFALSQLGSVFLSEGQKSKAFELFTRSINAKPIKEALFNIGVLYRDGFIDGMNARQQSRAMALDYFKRSATLGFQDAKVEYNKLIRAQNS